MGVETEDATIAVREAVTIARLLPSNHQPLRPYWQPPEKIATLLHVHPLRIPKRFDFCLLAFSACNLHTI